MLPTSRVTQPPRLSRNRNLDGIAIVTGGSTMNNRRIWRTAMVSCCLVLCCAGGPAAAEEKVLFDFKDDATLKAWAQFLPDNPKVVGAKEPPVTIALARDMDRPCLKLTYSGGRFPPVATRSPLDAWASYKTFRAEVTAGRTCLVAFRVVRLDDERHHGWVKIALLQKGRNVVIDQAPAVGGRENSLGGGGQPFKGPVVTQFEVLMYAPHDGESLLVHEVRLSTEAPQTATPYHGEHLRMGDAVRLFPKPEKIRVLGLEAPVASAAEFGKQMTEKWVPPEDKSVEQVEADFQALYQRLQKDHPRAVMAIFRNGQKGYDPAGPDKAYAGWACTGASAHGPNATQLELVRNLALAETMEVSLRGRPPLLRCDFSSIPRGSDILAARLLLVRSTPLPKDWGSRRPYFVAECCNRPWKETEVNTFEYAKDQFWKELHGMNWDGDDPDFLPLIMSHGPSQQTTSVWDFTLAARWWTDGKHPNHGFTLNNAVYEIAARDPLMVYTSRAKDARLRPALLVVYEPKQ
jgi:hypothetical protein